MNPASSSAKPTCSRCGATDKEIIKRIRGVIYSPVPDSQWLRVVDSIKREKLAFADALARFGYEQVQIATIGRKQFCQHCGKFEAAKALKNRKKQPADNSANGVLF